MTPIKTADSKLLIPIQAFNICYADELPIKDVCSLYTCVDIGKESGCCKLDKLIYHLKIVHQMTLQAYCAQYLQFDWPKCPVKGTLVGYRVSGKGATLSRFAKGGVSKEHCPKFAVACEQFSAERKGAGNPMWGKEAWNAGLTTETDERLRAMGEKRQGTFLPESAKEKMRQRRAESPIKARHTAPHSPETIESMRLETARRWAEGCFNRTTSIHIKMRDFLNTLPLKSPYVEEHQVWYFSMDFAFPEHKVAIECQGTYYHIDPRIYPDGPKDAIQRRNFGRDITKRKICCDREGWTIIEAWETEINDGSFKDYIQCRLNESGLLNR